MPTLNFDRQTATTFARDLRDFVASSGGQTTHTRALDFLAGRLGERNGAALCARLNKPAKPAPQDLIQPLPKGWMYLTNGCCESALNHHFEDFSAPQFGPTEFEAMGLGYSSFAGTFYPLAHEEAALVSENLASAEGTPPFVTSYTALWRGEKWLAPTAEIFWRSEEYPTDRTKEEATADCLTFIKAARPHLAALGGHVFFQPDTGPDDARHEIVLAIPFPAAIARASTFDAWKTELENLLGRIGAQLTHQAPPAAG